MKYPRLDKLVLNGKEMISFDPLVGFDTEEEALADAKARGVL